MRRTRIVPVVLVLAAACAAQSDPFDQLVERLEAGADCPELFELRGVMHPKNPRYAEAGLKLGEVGCYSATGTRTPPADSVSERFEAIEAIDTDSL